jgi:Flp pilus assembly protein TadG
MLRQFRSAAQRRGTATVELAVLLPFLAFFFVVAIDWCRIFYLTTTIQNASRNAAYYCSEYPGVTNTMIYGYTDARDAAEDDLEANMDSTQMQMYYGPYPSGTLITSGVLGTGIPSSTDSYGTKVKIITVTYPFSMVSNFPFSVPGIPTSVTMSRTVTMATAPLLPN